MNRDVLLSIALHSLIILAALATASVSTPKLDLGEVIKVSLSVAPQMQSTEPQPLPPPDIPQAIEPEFDDIALEDPLTAPKAKIVKPKPKPKKPKVKKQPQQAKKTASDSKKETNSKEVSSTGGSPFAGATVDKSNFEYPYWFTQAFYKIQSNWRNPVAADYSLVCLVYFKVLKSGRVLDVSLKQSSGIDAYDNACLVAVERSAPFPPLPRDFHDEIIGITLPFKFDP